jgi:uncharacterized protein (TIGR00159 family)
VLDRLIEALHLRDLLGVWTLVDLAVLALIIYQLLLLIRGTRAVQILIGVAILVFLHLITGPGLIPLPAFHSVLGSLLLYLPFVIIVLFQNQIRQALTRVGRNPLSALRPRSRQENLAHEIALAAASLASKRMGALIVIERELGLRAFAETGIALDALPTYDLLMTVFTKDSPLHDGAAIVGEGRIKAASCYLPLTVNPSLSRTYGTRHRAAIGITEESDALAIVVSEERGTVGLAEGGRIEEGLDAQALSTRLQRALAPRHDAGRGARRASPLAVTRIGDV